MTSIDLTIPWALFLVYMLLKGTKRTRWGSFYYQDRLWYQNELGTSLKTQNGAIFRLHLRSKQLRMLKI